MTSPINLLIHKQVLFPMKIAQDKDSSTPFFEGEKREIKRREDEGKTA